MSDLNEHLFEIRYTPNAEMIDNRGKWAQKISDHMGMADWIIVANRIDFIDYETMNRAFLGFRNSGFVCHQISTANYFSEHVNKFIDFILGLNDFTFKTIERIGLRSRFYVKFDKSFKELMGLYMSNYFGPSEKAKGVLKAEIIDVGGPLNYADEHGNFNTMSGPMIADQVKQLFLHIKDENQVPPVGLFLDIDYWVKPNKEMAKNEILKTIDIFAKKTWERNDEFKNIVLG